MKAEKKRSPARHSTGKKKKQQQEETKQTPTVVEEEYYEDEDDDDEEEEEDEYDEEEESQVTSPPVKTTDNRLKLNLPTKTTTTNNDNLMVNTDRVVLSKSVTGRKSNCLPQNMRPQAWINQKNLQINFLESENKNLKEKVQMLQKNLKLNKDMMNTLISDSQDYELKQKEILEQMNKENTDLWKKMSALEKERDQMLGNQLINQQILQDMQNKEEELQAQNEAQIHEITDKLEKKEYQLQVCELKIYHYEKYLQRKALTEKESRLLLFKFQHDEEANDKNTKICNVIEENTQLKTELKDAFKEVNLLTNQVQERNARILNLEKELKDLKSRAPDTSPGTHQDEVEMSIFEQTNISMAQNDEVVNLDKLKRIEKFFPQEYPLKLEMLCGDYEKQLKSLKSERKYLKSENTVLKESNDNNQYVISQLNTALTKATGRIKVLEEKIGVHDKILQFQQQARMSMGAKLESLSPQKMQSLGTMLDWNDEKVIQKLAEKQMLKRKEAEELGLDPNEFGNLSSIMINPAELEAFQSNMLQSVKGDGGTFNFAKEMEIFEQKS